MKKGFFVMALTPHEIAPLIDQESFGESVERLSS